MGKYDYSKEYFIDENPVYTIDDNSPDFSKLIKELKKRYPKLSTFKKVSTYLPHLEDLKPFITFLKENPKKCFDVVLDQDIFYPSSIKEDIPYYHSFTIIDEDFSLVFKRDFKRDCTLCCLIFFNDFETVKNKFFTHDIRKYSPGIYELRVGKNGFYTEAVTIKNIEDPILEDQIMTKLNKDISLFFKNKEFYEKNNLPKKRGVIIHGPHGNGKTSLIKKIISDYPDSYRLIVDCKIFDQSLSEFIEKIFPENKDKIIIFEDVEAISEGRGQYQYSNRSSFLNFIDGPRTLENTLFIATTNYPELIDPALIDRPSRFDKIYKIDLPNENSRKKFLLKYFPYLEKDSCHLDYLVNETKNFSGAYFKELFILVGIQGSTLEEAVADLKKQIKINKNKNYNKSKNNLGIMDEY
jgi:hypothetical protein